LLLNAAAVPLGLRFVDALNEMQRAQWSSTDELQARSETRLRLLLKHAAENVPFYQELHLSPDLEAFPILAKADFRQHEHENFCAVNVDPGLRIDRKTSGSTGQPFQFSLDRRAQPIIFASHLFYDSWYGLEPLDPYVRIVSPLPPSTPLPSTAPAKVRLKATIISRMQQLYEKYTQEKIFVWEIDSQRAESVWRRLEKFRPRFVMGYTSSLATLAGALLQNNLRLSRPVRGVITIAETLTPNRKRLIEEYFQAPIINRYGLREFGSWSAQSCRESPDQFHINTELVVCEILRPEGTPCAPGERGRVVLTDLHNFARPFIRYDTGDLAVAGTGKCACGRGFPLLGAIEGRSLECLRTPSGAEISPAILGHFLFVYHGHVDAVRHYQLVQESADRIRLLIVPGPSWDEEKSARLQSDLVGLVGNEMAIEIQTVSEIPAEKSGKRPIIKVFKNEVSSTDYADSLEKSA
jgi:phenylacetate-coenzyme A ligase PaaK-like adenylate-forming protein